MPTLDMTETLVTIMTLGRNGDVYKPPHAILQQFLEVV